MRYPLQLVDVRLYEAHLTRPDEMESEIDTEKGIPLGIEVGSNRMPPDRVSVFLTLTTKGDDDPFDVKLVLEGLFESQCDLDDLDADFWEEFLAVSAPTLIWPYARECIGAVAWRMRLDLPVFPTLNRLAMVKEYTEESGDEARATAGDCKPNV
jgi:preprotein translocase subunit SecB